MCPDTAGYCFILAQYIPVYMSSPVHIMVLCNNEMAIPAMQLLYQNGSLGAVLVPEKNTTLFSLMKQMLTGTGVSLISVNKRTLEPVIKKTATEKNITAAWLMTFSYIIPKPLLSMLPAASSIFITGCFHNTVEPILCWHKC